VLEDCTCRSSSLSKGMSRSRDLKESSPAMQPARASEHCSLGYDTKKPRVSISLCHLVVLSDSYRVLSPSLDNLGGTTTLLFSDSNHLHHLMRLTVPEVVKVVMPIGSSYHSSIEDMGFCRGYGVYLAHQSLEVSL
jgi:hypothetical protein